MDYSHSRHKDYLKDLVQPMDQLYATSQSLDHLLMAGLRPDPSASGQVNRDSDSTLRQLGAIVFKEHLTNSI
jgi:hypothetical protein